MTLATKATDHIISRFVDRYSEEGSQGICNQWSGSKALKHLWC